MKDARFTSLFWLNSFNGTDKIILMGNLYIQQVSFEMHVLNVGTMPDNDFVIVRLHKLFGSSC